MRLSTVKLGSFLAFCLILFYVFFLNFESWYIAVASVFLFILFYAIVLRFLKKRDSIEFRQFLDGWGEDVDPKIALATRPIVRGLAVFEGRKIFTRIGSDSCGIYLYKQGCYSVLLRWDRISTEKVGGTKNHMVKVISKNMSRSQFLLSWSDTFDKWL